MKIRLKKEAKIEKISEKGKEKSWRPRNKKRKWIRIVIGVIAVAVAGGGVGYHYLYAKDSTDEVQYQEVSLQSGDLSLDFSEDGTTQISTTAQKPAFDVTVATLEVEEVYVASGDTVAEGDALLKITDDSLAEAVTYYENAVADAKDTVTDAQTSYDAGVVEAKYTLDTTSAKAASADTIYQASLSELDQTVADKKSALETAQNQIATYTSNLANNTYYTENGIDEKNAAVTTAEAEVDSAKKAYDAAKKDYSTLNKTVSDEISALEEDDTIKTQITQLQEDYKSLTDNKDATDTAEEALEKAQSDLSQKQEEAKQAQSSYEKAVSDATQKKEQLENSLEQLQSDYDTAVRDAVTSKVTIQNTYDTAVVNGNYAQTTYNSTVTTLQNTLDAANTALAELQEEQSALLSLNDGVVTATKAGTIAAVTYEAGDTLIANTQFVSYYDTDTIMISVEVPQEKLQYINVSDTMDVAISNVRGGNLTGTIQSIATSATTGGSVSNVTYAVVVTVDNSEGSISTGLSATVNFTYGELSDVYYISNDAISNISGDSADVKQYDENGDVISVPVTIGDVTDEYTVVTEGISEDDICLIEVGGEE